VRRGRVDRALIVAGFTVVALGVLFLLDRLSVFDLRFDYAAPAVLAAIGLILLAAGLSS
jgi:hypothetical protein